MKNRLKMLSLASLLIFAQACSKDDNQITIQEHDKNQMMTIMHQMMDKMDAMEMTKDPDNDFAMMMTMHHQGAIDMANAELKDGTDATMKAIAQKMISAQTQEIAQLNTFLQAHPAHLSVPEFDAQMMMGMEKMGRNADLQIINGRIDHDFAILMAQHHQSAIEMSKMELDYGTHSEMKTMASNIIEDQEKEIKELQEWLLANNNK
ncbi:MULTISPECIES: DUF305 domain-containing protein [Pedobacter]|uniref:Uncharacterized conserved protein, DUF305 family n=1 Tax=Pedobacter westerhofensis TaxID=425512 RepID=A0A521DSB6_9SPHI|nr:MULTISPECIES: DUF305 domain-containing protein [Pedobacter]KQR68340.1 hypothetical protein ASF92_15870 [Pedobacter sp. Leaf176]SMO74472.1 Uncharacterized conserved protein, DUF305 family [Pedobacter westerhofensis]